MVAHFVYNNGDISKLVIWPPVIVILAVRRRLTNFIINARGGRSPFRVAQ